MRRRSSAGINLEAQPRKTAARKSRITSKAVRPRSSSAAREETKVARLTRERDEALQRQTAIANENTRLLAELRESLQQQTATADVLKVISRSTFDLQTVLDTLMESAARLCGADMGAIMQRDGDVYRMIANHAFSPEVVQYTKEHPLPGNRASAIGRAAVEGRAVHIADVLADPEYRATGHQQATGYRTALAVPLLRDGKTIGVFGLLRDEVNPFTDKQIELLTNFAAQAVIAIENTRLFETEQQRTRELTESLEQQTATSDVLRVISSSPSDIQPVLETIGERAGKLCNAELSAVSIVDGELIRLASIHGMTEAEVEAARRAFPVRRTDETVHARAIRTRSVCQVADVLRDPQYQLKDTARVSGYRGCLGVPMVRGEQAVGAIVLARREPGLFSEAQVQLLKTFADQAVIAIENVRLFKETKNSLEQQTATADVLKVISRSTFDLPTVLRTLTESAARLCVADKGIIVLVDGDVYRLVANYGFSPEALRYAAEHPVRRDHDTLTGRVALEGRAIQIRDVLADPEYRATGYRRRSDTGLPLPCLSCARKRLSASFS